MKSKFIINLLILLLISSVIQGSIIDYDNVTPAIINFVLYKDTPSLLNYSYIANPGLGVNIPPINPSYGDLVVYYQSTGVNIYDVIVGIFFIETECFGAITMSLSNKQGNGVWSPIPPNSNTIKLSADMTSLMISGDVSNSSLMNTSATCGTASIGMLTFTNSYTYNVNFVLINPNGFTIYNRIVQSGETLSIKENISEAYTINILSMGGDGFGFVGSMLYLKSTPFLTGILLSSPPVRYRNQLSENQSYIFILTSSGLILK